MRNLLFALALCVCLIPTGCVAEWDDPPSAVPANYNSGSVEFCDDWGCRMVDAPYYYSNGGVVYWDAHFGVWIGPRGYWGGGVWHSGLVEGYHGWYHEGHYHSFYSSPRGWRAGSGYHGYHGGGGGHYGGGRGGHR